LDRDELLDFLRVACRKLRVRLLSLTRGKTMTRAILVAMALAGAALIGINAAYACGPGQALICTQLGNTTRCACGW
jgi:hypothetical protein